MKLTAIVLVLLITLGAIFVTPALAQSTWTHSFLGANSDPTEWLTLETKDGGIYGSCTPTLEGNIIVGCGIPQSANWTVFDLDFPVCTITSVSVTVEYERTRNYQTDTNYLLLNSQQIASHIITGLGTGSFTLSSSNLNIQTGHLYFYGFARSNYGTDGYHHVTNITLSGNGQDPFINGSCDDSGPTDPKVHPLAPGDRDSEWGINALFDMDYIYGDDPDYFPGIWLTEFPQTPPPGYTLGNPPVNTSLGGDYFTLLPEWYSTFAISNDYNDNVLNIEDGYVVSVTPLTEDVCRQKLNPFAETWFYNKAFRHQCILVMPRSVTPGQDDTAYLVDPLAAYLVTIQAADGNFIEYIVTHPTVEAGANILAGCILGKTLELLKLNTTELDSVGISAGFSAGMSGAGGNFGGSVSWKIVSPIIGKGLAWVTLRSANTGESLSLRDSLVIDEPGSTACTSDESLADCLGSNPKFEQGGQGWTSTGAVLWNEPGATLQPGAQIATTFVLQSGYADYYANFNHSTGGYPSTLQVTVDQDTRQFTSRETAQNTQYQIPTIQATSGMVAVILKNTGTIPIFVEYFCITDGVPAQPPGICYFKDHSFTYGSPGSSYTTNQWTLSPGVGLNDPVIESGGLFVFNTGTFAQPVTLYPQDDGSAFDYRLVLTYRILYNETVANWTVGEAQISMEWPETTGFNLIETRPITDVTAHLDSSQWKQQEFQTQYILSVDTSPVSGVMTFLGNNQFNSDMLGLLILEACIQPVTAPDFPGTPGGGGYIPPFQENCTGDIPYPIGGDVGAWTAWHWHNLDQFFQCDLMLMLNSIHKTALDTLSMLSWLFRYFVALQLHTDDWITDSVIPWLNGHFNNLASGRLTYVDQGGGNANLWDVILALIQQVVAPIVDLLTRLLGGAAELLFNVVNAIISIVFGFFTQLFQFLSLIQSLLGSVVLSWNDATPANVPGVPNCAVNPQQSLICVGMWTMDNTIFSGPGTLIIPLIISIASIHFFIWAARDIKKVFMSIGNV